MGDRPLVLRRHFFLVGAVAAVALMLILGGTKLLLGKGSGNGGGSGNGSGNGWGDNGDDDLNDDGSNGRGNSGKGRRRGSKPPPTRR